MLCDRLVFMHCSLQGSQWFTQQTSVHSLGLCDGREHHFLLSVDAHNASHSNLSVTVDRRCTVRLSYPRHVQMGGYTYVGGVETNERLPWLVVSRYGFLGYMSKCALPCPPPPPTSSPSSSISISIHLVLLAASAWGWVGSRLVCRSPNAKPQPQPQPHLHVFMRGLCRIMLNKAYLKLDHINTHDKDMLRDVRLDQAIAIDHCRGSKACVENFPSRNTYITPVCGVVPTTALGNGTFQCDCSLTEFSSSNCSGAVRTAEERTHSCLYSTLYRTSRHSLLSLTFQIFINFHVQYTTFDLSYVNYSNTVWRVLSSHGVNTMIID